MQYLAMSCRQHLEWVLAEGYVLATRLCVAQGDKKRDNQNIKPVTVPRSETIKAI